MTAPFECEVRLLIEDLGAFQERLRAIGARVIREYAFTDHYYRPAGRAWSPHEHALRIREHLRPASPAEVLLTWTEMRSVDGLRFKRSRLPDGKARLFCGAVDDCRTVVGGLGFEPWLVVRKDAGIMYTAPEFGNLVIEQVAGIGWMCELEVEGRDPDAAAQAIRQKLTALGAPVDAAIPEPLASYVGRRTRHGRRVYFSGSIRGGRALQPLYAAIVAFLQRRGYEVLTTHVAAPDVLAPSQPASSASLTGEQSVPVGTGLVQERREDVGAPDIYERDVRWLQESDLVIAEVSVPSLGVGVEIATAQQLGKPILCLCRADAALSAMVEGNRYLRVIRYRDEAQLMSVLERELRD